MEDKFHGLQSLTPGISRFCFNQPFRCPFERTLYLRFHWRNHIRNRIWISIPDLKNCIKTIYKMQIDIPCPCGRFRRLRQPWANFIPTVCGLTTICQAMIRYHIRHHPRQWYEAGWSEMEWGARKGGWTPLPLWRRNPSSPRRRMRASSLDKT